MFILDRVVPWGRSFDEYRRMFALTDDDLQSRILGCADGPASFNAEATASGTRIVSCDPLYACSADEIAARIRDTADTVIEQTHRNENEFVWTSMRSIEHLRATRMSSMARFLDDLERGGEQGRYVVGELPNLPFIRTAFDLAVCSHFLFLYSEQLTEDFHVDAILEMGRIAKEVRIFPLLTLGAKRSPHVETVCDRLRGHGFIASMERVDYEFQRGGNEMLRVVSRGCDERPPSQSELKLPTR